MSLDASPPLPPQGEVWGIERSAEQLCRAKAADLRTFVSCRRMPKACLSEEARFDVVYCRFLLEHVAAPATVLREMRRVLTPGGKLFVQENNILVSTLHPACPHFDELWLRFAKLQERLGGDALIGKKLYQLLSEAGFRDIRLSIEPEIHWFGAPTFRAWLENLVDNIQPAEDRLIESGLATAEQIKLGTDELRRHMENATASTSSSMESSGREKVDLNHRYPIHLTGFGNGSSSVTRKGNRQCIRSTLATVGSSRRS